MDPRVARIRAELGRRLTIIVASAKGGVGKTVVTGLLGLALADMGRKPLLVDLDVTDPNLHVVLGIDPARTWPGEERGIKPVQVDGIGYVGIAPYTRNRPAPMRGPEEVDAARELLAATDYEGYDTVILDTPPGLDDILLDLLENVPSARLLIVTTPSRMSRDSLDRFKAYLEEQGYIDYIVITNMGREPGENTVPHDHELETSLGDPARLRRTAAYAAIRAIARRLVEGHEEAH